MHLGPRSAAVVRTAHRVLRGDLSVMSAGVALYALLAALPALTAIVSIYSLVANPVDIEPQLSGLVGVLPRPVVGFLVAQLEREASRPHDQLGLALGGSLALALWSARAAAAATVDAVHHAYGCPETRNFSRRFMFRISMALATIIGLLVTAAIVVALPAVVALIGLGETAIDWVGLARWPVLLVVYTGSMAALYRLAPSPRPMTRRRLAPGALAATVLWLAGSYGLSTYVQRINDYENVYGAFGGVVVVILWFYVSALSVLLGGVLNAELERAAAPAGE